MMYTNRFDNQKCQNLNQKILGKITNYMQAESKDRFGV